MVPVHREVSRVKGTSQRQLLLSRFDQVFGSMGDFRMDQAYWGVDKEAEGRAQGSLLLQPSSPGFYLREVKTSQKLPHCVQDSPAPRRQRVTGRGAWSPWQHQEPRTAAGWGRDSWVSGVECWPSCSLTGAFAYDVTALCLCRLPCPLHSLPAPKVSPLCPSCPLQPLSKGWV